MSEDLKPCPACGGRAFVYRMGRDVRVECADCSVSGPNKNDVAAAREAWNALPRALVWTTTPPRESGVYWHKNCLGINIITLSRPNIPERDEWYWAGPIPTPQEPKS